jgi:hypothetical protein
MLRTLPLPPLLQVRVFRCGCGQLRARPQTTSAGCSSTAASLTAACASPWIFAIRLEAGYGYDRTQGSFTMRGPERGLLLGVLLGMQERGSTRPRTPAGRGGGGGCDGGGGHDVGVLPKHSYLDIALLSRSLASYSFRRSGPPLHNFDASSQTAFRSRPRPDTLSHQDRHVHVL